MSNDHAPKKHGMKKVNRLRPKSSLRKRRNKAKARARRLERQKKMTT